MGNINCNIFTFTVRPSRDLYPYTLLQLINNVINLIHVDTFLPVSSCWHKMLKIIIRW